MSDIIYRIGYLCITLLVLQAISLPIIALLQFTVFNHMEPAYGGVDEANQIVHTYGAPIITVQPDTGNWVVVSTLWIALSFVIALIVLYTSNVMSALLKKALRHWRGRVTVGNLFTTKFVLPGATYVFVSLFALLLPAVYLLLPVNALVALLALVCFWIQYNQVHKNKTPVSKIL